MGEQGEISQDGNWRWDGTQWQPIEQVDQSNDGDNSSPQLEEKATPAQDSDFNPTSSSVEQKEINEEKESPDKLLTILAIGVLAVDGDYPALDLFRSRALSFDLPSPCCL